MNKPFKLTALLLALLLPACSLTVSLMTLHSLRTAAREQSAALEQLRRTQFNPFDPQIPEYHATGEDGVTIAGRYVIRSTTAISDAYRSGDSSGLSAKDRETLNMASAILEEIITDAMSPYEKELAVYQWMVKTLSYDTGALSVIPQTEQDCENPYGVLKHHNAVCVGYATTFRLFMQMLDIPCMVIHNDERGHSWNLVQLDGHWYHVDVYADVGKTGFAAFNLNDELVRQRLESWDTDFFPAADALTYNYCWQNRKSVDNIYDIPVLIRESLDAGGEALAFSFSAALEEQDMILAQRMLYALDSALSDNGAAAMPRTIREQRWGRGEDGAYYVLLSFSYETSRPDSSHDPTPESLLRADEALQKAFGDLFDISLDAAPSYWGVVEDYMANDSGAAARG